MSLPSYWAATLKPPPPSLSASGPRADK
ncbi:hypothetical protein E2C01_055346 [Portunus trituberculatus]|uniref:Uncharacterized protein n=1 Tax=Portunus trituberculatus TaxID=210409 RepID=A0A5B7GVN9_PORTR|nr:hypothetical protein [Portunus trituberculatus]